MSPQFVQQQDIDRHAWDRCVEKAINGRPYAYSWYLDQVADRWDALISSDYSCIFPLVWNNKLLLYKQLYQPPFTQQLGLFSIRPIDELVLKTFIEAIPAHFHYVHLHLNEMNPLHSFGDWQVSRRPNYILLLNAPYSTLRDQYSKTLLKNLKTALKFGPVVEKGIDPEVVLNLLKKRLAAQDSPLNPGAYRCFSRLLRVVTREQKGFCWGIKDGDGGFGAAAFFLTTHRRLTYLAGSSTEVGRKQNAMHFLLDQLIRQYADTGWIFDFEGSSIPSIAKFFRGFGSLQMQYYVLKKDHLPSWFRPIREALR